MSSDVLSLCLWFFLPDLATSFLLSLYHKLLTPRSSIPAGDTHRYRVQRNNVYVLVICLYLVYSLSKELWELSAAAHQGGNYYVRFNGLTPTAMPADIRSQFRRLSLVFHPDKYQHSEDALRIDGRRSSFAENAGATDDQVDNAPMPSYPGDAKAYAEFAQQQFIQITAIYKILGDPVTRRAYDHFGDSTVSECYAQSTTDFMANKGGQCRLFTDYLYYYIKTEMLPFFVISGAFLLLMSLFRTFAFGTLWRYITLFNLAVLELYLVTQQPLIIRFTLANFLHGLTVHELIILLHHLFAVFFIAINQLGPIFVSGVHSFHIPLRTSEGANTRLPVEAYIQPTSLQQLQSQLEPILQKASQLALLTHAQAINDFRGGWEPFKKDAISSGMCDSIDPVSISPTSVASYTSKQANATQRIRKRMERTLVEQTLIKMNNEYRERYNETMQRVAQTHN